MSGSPSAAAAVAPDDGNTPAALARVLASRRKGRAGIRELATALARERLLVPLLEVSGDQLEGSDTDPCAGQDKAVAAVFVQTDEGVLGLAFTSLAALARWDTRARPWPTPAPRVAAALLADGGLRLLIDPGSEQAIPLVGVALQRLATEAAWPDPWEDPAVRDAVVAELAPVLASGEVAVRLSAPDDVADRGSGLRVELAFPAATSHDLAHKRSAIVAERLSRNSELRTVFDGTLVVQAHVRDASAAKPAEVQPAHD